MGSVFGIVVKYTVVSGVAARRAGIPVISFPGSEWIAVDVPGSAGSSLDIAVSDGDRSFLGDELVGRVSPEDAVLHRSLGGIEPDSAVGFSPARLSAMTLFIRILG